MVEEINEKNEFPQNDPPGDEWVLIRSGKAKSKTEKGNKIPEKWLSEDRGHIFVRNKETSEWFIYNREKEIFHPTPEQWQVWAGNIWEKESLSPSAELRQEVRRLLSADKQIDIFTSDNKVNWPKLFKLINKVHKTRDEVFPEGTEDMSESEIYSYILKNYGMLLMGSVDPLEFPEIIDEGLRPLCNIINKTDWGRSQDGCTGHLSSEEGHLSIGYKEPYLRVFLDLDNPKSDSFIDKVTELSEEWQKKYKNLRINLRKEDAVSTKDKARIIKFSFMLKIDSPNEKDKETYFDSEECRQIGASFFEELEKRIK